MSSSSAERTERATPRRRRAAKREGRHAISRDLASAASFATCITLLSSILPSSAGALETRVRLGIEAATSSVSIGQSDAVALVDEALWRVVAVVLAPATCALIVGALTFSLQTGGAFRVATSAPKLARLDPIAGLRRLVQLRTFVELAKTVAKVALVGVAVASAVMTNSEDLAHSIAAGGEPTLAVALVVLRTAGSRVALALLLLGAADLLVQRWLTERDLRMTKDEVRRDHKEDEGDPHVKSARKRIHLEIAMNKMIDATRTASFIAVNPTHLAVAVHYDDEKPEAPRVVAKGSGRVARRIREAADAVGIYSVHDKKLARELFAVPVGEEIPEALYVAVAEVLACLRDLGIPMEEHRPPADGGPRRQG